MDYKRGFASDNNSGVHPRVLQALEAVNHGHVIGYGDDPVTQELEMEIKRLFGDATAVYPVFNGTGANVIALQSVCRSFHAIICAETAHINVDECGAPQKFTGAKTISIHTPDGKLSPERIVPYLHGFGFEHHSQPKVISITQVTEMGTLYQPDEIKALSDLAHSHGMFLHMDGARIANAAAALNLPFKAFTIDCGVDIVSFGGTKNGLMFGELVLFFNRDHHKYTKYYRKQASQLFSKMRYISAQFLAYLEDEVWLENARHSNKMALLLQEKVKDIPGITITQKVEANGVFVIVPGEIIEPLQKEFFFYPWDENKNEVRWMCSFDTSEQDIDLFVQRIKELKREFNV